MQFKQVHFFRNSIFFLAALTFAFFVIGVFLQGATVRQSSVSQPSVKTVPNFDFEVLYTSAGFIPSTIEIPPNSRVAFRNISDISLWVASDPHPAHTDYPQFDATAAGSLKEVNIFEFKNAGTFGFHNHEKSIDRGTVRVIDPANPVPNIDKTTESQRAVRDKLLALFDARDSDSIFKIVDAIQADPVLLLNCHEIAHDIGHRSYQLFGFSEAMAFNNPKHLGHPLVQYICAGGYMHGILEGLSLQQPEFKTKPSVMCERVDGEARESCFHGVGHVFMFANKRDVPASLAGCRSIGNSADTYRCFEGLWMEMFWGKTEHAGPDSLGWDLANPIAPCVSAETDAKPTCFLYSTFGYLRTHAKDYSGAVQMCTASALSQSDTNFCLKGLGITMMSKFKGQNLEGSEVFVDGLSAEKKRAFYEGVMGYARLSGLGEEKLNNACGLLKTDMEICLGVLKDAK